MSTLLVVVNAFSMPYTKPLRTEVNDCIVLFVSEFVLPSNSAKALPISCNGVC